ncbi:MAG TPA: extracellular solute-binding protein [Verrucomicrobiae bacterium]|jgi:iron(III) transport system substrate-binding protein|nr:extracellular solute-binding protein [Verrucomicrobiae bacterium]
MRARASNIFIALVLLCAPAAAAEGSSVETTLEEINKLPPQQRQKRLEEGARREGAFVQYSVSNAELINAFSKAFIGKYPFIKADFWRGSGNQLVFRTFMEHRAGKLAADVISVGTENVIAMKEAGLYARYRSPESQFYPPEQSDRDGYFHSDSLGLSTIAYNNRLVKKEEAPKGYNDLLDPKWKGTLTIDLEPERALMAWLLSWGETKTRQFVQKLLDNGTTVRRGHTLQAQLLCAGEFKIAVEIYPDAILRMKQSGCPATIVFGNPTSGVVGGNYAIYANAAHPHAAALFVDFALSAEGAKILAATGRVQRRKGMKALYEELSDLDEKGVPLLVVTPEQTAELTKPMEKIMKELLVK